MKNKCNDDLIRILSMCTFSYLRGWATKCLQCFVYIIICWQWCYTQCNCTCEVLPELQFVLELSDSLLF